MTADKIEALRRTALFGELDGRGVGEARGLRGRGRMTERRGDGETG